MVWILWASATGVYIQNRWAKRKSNFGFKLESSFRKLLLVLYCNATMDEGSNWSYHKAVAYCNSEGLRLSWYQSTHFHFNYLAVMSIRALPATYKVDFLFLTRHIFYRAKSSKNLTIWQGQQSFLTSEAWITLFDNEKILGKDDSKLELEEPEAPVGTSVEPSIRGTKRSHPASDDSGSAVNSNDRPSTATGQSGGPTSQGSGRRLEIEICWEILFDWHGFEVWHRCHVCVFRIGRWWCQSKGTRCRRMNLNCLLATR